jgi:hypothetical protein
VSPPYWSVSFYVDVLLLGRPLPIDFVYDEHNRRRTNVSASRRWLQFSSAPEGGRSGP